MSRVAIAGGGMAGLYTAIALREKGFAGEITLVGAESHHPYDRPPLSKEILTGKADTSVLAADWDDLALDLRQGVTAHGVEGNALATSGGEVGFDHLVVATGSYPLWLPGSQGLAGVHVLRTIEDSVALRAGFVPGAKVVIIGAGWIGAEVATAAAAAGCDVTVVEAMAYPLAAAMPAEIGSLTERWYAEAGIRLMLSSPVASVESGAVHLTSGESLPADLILVGIGVRPQTGWLGDAVELTDRGAVVVDDHCRSSRADIYAVGDCTLFPSRRFGTALHVEHWDNARRQPIVAASHLIDPETAEAYDPVPYFWSQQFGRMVQYVGHHPIADRLVWRGDSTEEKWSAFWLAGDRLVAAIGVGKPRDVIQGRGLIERNETVDVNALIDVTVPVAQASAA